MGQGRRTRDKGDGRATRATDVHATLRGLVHQWLEMADPVPPWLESLRRENDALFLIPDRLRAAARERARHPAPKTVYLVRHAESTHNATHDFNERDPGLTERGLASAAAARATPEWAEAAARAQLLVASPLRRAVRSALCALRGAAGRAPDAAQIDTALALADPAAAVPLVVIAQMAVVHLKKPPADVGLFYPCDMGRTPAEIRRDTPRVDVSALADDWMTVPPVASLLTEAGLAGLTEALTTLLRWLEDRPEQTMAVFGHRTLFAALTGQNLRRCDVRRFILQDGVLVEDDGGGTGGGTGVV